MCGGAGDISDFLRTSCYHLPNVCLRMPTGLAPNDPEPVSGMRECEIVHAPAADRAGRLPTASGTMARLACAQTKMAGVALQPLLKSAGLTLHQIEEPHARLPVRNQIIFLNLVSEALKDDFLGFHLAQLPDLREIGLLYYVLASSETLIEALQRAARYSSLNNEGISLKCIDGMDVGMSFHYVGVSRHLDRHQIEFWVTALVRTCRQLTGRRLLPTRLQLIHLREQSGAKFAEFFGNDIEFGAVTDEIVFPQGDRNLRVVSADPYLNSLLIEYCEEALSHRPTVRGPFRSSVENAIVPLLPHGKARADEIARRLGVSQRTFARRLALEGVTFSDLLESLRSDLARRYFADPDLSISQIAWLLGYREVGAFSHAFKRWTGKTPRQARSQMDEFLSKP
jgi:AraC-like DNA-binding protein